MVVKIISGYGRGETSSEYFGTPGSVITETGYYYCKNGINTSTALSKRTGTQYAFRTFDNQKASFVNVEGKILIIGGGKTFIYDPTSNELIKETKEYEISETLSNNIYKVKDASGLVKDDVIYHPGCDTFYRIDDKGSGQWYMESMIGKYPMKIGDKFFRLKSINVPTNIKDITPFSGGVMFINKDTNQLYVINRDYTSNAYPVNYLPAGTIDAIHFLQNRLFVVTYDNNISTLSASRINNFNLFDVSASNATLGISFNLPYTGRVAWLSSTNKGLVIGTENGIFGALSKTANNIIDATAPFVPEFISEVGAAFVEPCRYYGGVLYVGYDGDSIYYARQDVYTDSIKVRQVSRNFEQPELRGKFKKILNFSYKEANIVLLTDCGNLLVCKLTGRQDGGIEELMLGSSLWDFGFKGYTYDVTIIRSPLEHDGLLLCNERQLSNINRFTFIEKWLPPDEIARPEIISQFRYERREEDSFRYETYLKSLSYKNPYLDLYVRYEPFKKFEGKTLYYNATESSLTSVEDVFDQSDEKHILEIGATVFTVKQYIDPRKVILYPNAYSKNLIEAGGMNIQQSRYIHPTNYKFKTDIVKCLGIMRAEDYEQPIFMVDRQWEVRKFERLREFGTYKIDVPGSEFIVGLPYHFIYISNCLADISMEESRRITGVNLKFIYSGTFISGDTFTEDESEHDPNLTDNYNDRNYESVVSISAVSQVRSQITRLVLRQKNSAPFNLVEIVVRLT